jgi:hypothetical protein
MRHEGRRVHAIGILLIEWMRDNHNNVDSAMEEMVGWGDRRPIGHWRQTCVKAWQMMILIWLNIIDDDHHATSI